MRNDIAIAWLDGIRTEVSEKEPRDALLKGIEAIEKLEKIEKIINDWNDGKCNNIICCLDIKAVIEDGKID